MASALPVGGFAGRSPIRRASVMAGFACVLLAGTSAARAADITYERLANPEPQNWLMHHHDFSGQRFSALDTIDKSNIKDMKLLFAVALGGSSRDDSLEATPLVEDGFMYVVDSSGVVSKIDVRSGMSGPIMWQMNPKQEKPDRNRGVALWNNLVISVTGYEGRVVATDKETGRVVWDKNLLDRSEVGLTELTAAPLALKDTILVASSGGDHGVRSWLASLDPKTGNVLWKTYSIPAPGEAGSETWKDKNNAWQTGGGAFYGTGAYDPATNLTYWGSGNPVPAYDTTVRSLSTPPAARSSGFISTRPTITAITTRPAATSSSTPRSTARTAGCSSIPPGTGSNTPSTASAGSSSRRCRPCGR
jgi:alcohol dehydrogenase (cytochrome c)